MFIEKGTILSTRNWESLLKDETIEKVNILGRRQARKDNIYYNEEMMKCGNVAVPQSCNVNFGFVANGWMWYPWMFEELPNNLLDNE